MVAYILLIQFLERAPWPTETEHSINPLMAEHVSWSLNLSKQSSISHNHASTLKQHIAPCAGSKQVVREHLFEAFVRRAIISIWALLTAFKTAM